MTLPLIITEGKGPTLLGRNWLEALRLDWQTIFRLGSSCTLPQVLDKHAQVFNEELGELKGVAAKIHVDQDARPRFKKPAIRYPEEGGAGVGATPSNGDHSTDPIH